MALAAELLAAAAQMLHEEKQRRSNAPLDILEGTSAAYRGVGAVLVRLRARSSVRQTSTTI
ncbi:hypothetical protein NTGBS_500021 [Candidatus Nitrotoga sp. BS]|nr:hypothetical protein NTGBS_500021 [Candidatus Nitrotoga sp. BS]